MWRGKRHESRFLPFPFPWSPARFIFSFSPASLRHKEASAEGRANIWLFLYASKHCVPPFYTNTSLSLSFWVISLCIRSLLGFKKPGTHASALFVVKQQKSGECKLATSGTATFPRSSWPSRSPWMGWGSKFRSFRAKLLYLFLVLFFFLRKTTPRRARLGLVQEIRGERLDEDVAANARGGGDGEHIALLRINLFSIRTLSRWTLSPSPASHGLMKEVNSLPILGTTLSIRKQSIANRPTFFAPSSLPVFIRSWYKQTANCRNNKTEYKFWESSMTS